MAMHALDGLEAPPTYRVIGLHVYMLSKYHMDLMISVPKLSGLAVRLFSLLLSECADRELEASTRCTV